MKIAVVGAGIVGIAAAFELTLDGHEVTVYEKNASVAELSSFATGTLLAPSLTQPYSHMAWPQSNSLVRLVRNARQLPLASMMTPAVWTWLLRWSAAKPEVQFTEGFSASSKLISLSLERMRSVCHDMQIEFEESTGQLILAHSGTAQKCHEAKLAALKALGVHNQTLDAQDIAKAEPSLNYTAADQGAIFFAGDAIGNCRQFTQMLKDRAVQAGARLEFNSTVTGIHTGAQVEVTVAGKPPQVFDKIVLCTGHVPSELAGPLKVKVPGITAHSYSVSAQMREPLNGPRNAVFEPKRGISISRIGTRVRAVGGVHMGKHSKRAEKKAQDMLYRALQNYFPGAASMSNSTQFWKGSTWVTTDSLPVIGEGTAPGVYLNVGHGFNGWGMACGAARLLADEIASGKTAQEFSCLSPKRFTH